MSMMFDALRVLEMEQREEPVGAFLSGSHFLASTVSAVDFQDDEKSAAHRALEAVPEPHDTSKGRSEMDTEQLESLRRQVEEDYKLDIAAIQRLQLRYSDLPSASPSSVPSKSTSPAANPQPDEWANLRERAASPDFTVAPGSGRATAAR